MNYNFTKGARTALSLAREEAIALRHDYVGTEHILLGLIREHESVASEVLARAGLSPEAIRAQITAMIRPGKATVSRGELPYTSRSKKTLEYALATARDLNHQYVGSEHLLLGLLREEKSIAAQALNRLGLTADRALALVLHSLGEGPEPERPLLEIRIDDASELSIYEQIIAQVQEGVATGALLPGARLPAVRTLADQLNIAPGTVARSYSELERLGVVVTEGARGTRIAPRVIKLPDHTDRAETLAGLLRSVAVAAFHLGASAQEMRAALERAMQGILIDNEAPPPIDA